MYELVHTLELTDEILSTLCICLMLDATIGLDIITTSQHIPYTCCLYILDNFSGKI